MDGWVDGSKSWVKDCLQQSKNLAHLNSRSMGSRKMMWAITLSRLAISCISSTALKHSFNSSGRGGKLSASFIAWRRAADFFWLAADCVSLAEIFLTFLTAPFGFA